ncbi:MAG TPA: SPOR domain-containing protein [Methylophilaceae bacterium]|nr:SPOR domain-containing protein [Methylophilaceae bacterium]
MPPESSQAQLNDQEIQFKKRARRRLVGAVALVLIMVAVLPMVLDDHATKTPQQEISISIPSQDGSEFTSKIVPVTPAAVQPADVEEPVVESIPASPEPVQKPEIPVNKVAEQQTTKAVESTLVETSKPTVPKPEVAKPEATKPQQAKIEPVKKPVVAKAAEDKKPTEAASSTGPVYVQIGVFSDAANIKQLQQKLSTISLKSYTEKIDTPKGEKTRLRAGPFTSRPDAEAALNKIKNIGLNGMVVSK